RVVLARTESGVDPAEMLKKLRPRDFKATSQRGGTLYRSGADAFFVAGDNLVVFGDAATLANVLERDRDAVLAPALREELGRAEPHRGAVLAVDTGGLKGTQLTLARVDLTPLLQSLAART